MKAILFTLICLFFCSTLPAQDIYLIDTVRSIFFFGGTGGGINSTKYLYDDQQRLIEERFGNGIKFVYVYSGEFDYTQNYYGFNSDDVTYKREYFHNAEGYLIDETQWNIDFNTQELKLTYHYIYTRDDDNVLTERETYYLNEQGNEQLSAHKVYTYENGKEVMTVETFYDASGSPYYTYNYIYNYVGDLLEFSSIIFQSSNAVQKTDREYEYDSNGLVETVYTKNYNNSMLSGESYSEHEHNGMGDETILEYYKNFNTGEFYQSGERYISELITPFYTNDTTILSFGDDFFFNVEERFNSHYFSQDLDTAFVRREIHSTDFEIQSFINISKEIHLRYTQGPVTILEEEIVGSIYPNPASINSPIILNVTNEDVDQIILYNTTGQRVYNEPISAIGNQQIRPQVSSGIYFGQFYKKGQPIGQTIKLAIKE